ncbi:hypothetical protein [Pseudomonas sp. R37(2017)]|uniref:hypothetical protein n=1 Tax=Pseudomonas sp. R37(2017) TaxID=1981685 RepID=UPI000A1EC69D|nr:hypothetical protein [Pseudomonas sp. R37(2017)]
MKLFFSLRTMAVCSLAAGLLAGLHAPSVGAVEQEITAKFVPDPANPLVNKFVNTTPQTGVCPNYISGTCARLGIFSLRVPGLQFKSTQPIPAGHTDPRQGATFSVPSSWRSVDVVHSRTGERETVEIRIAGIGGTWALARPPGVSAWTPPGGTRWREPWTRPPAPCTGLDINVAGTFFAFFFWLIPEGAGACGLVPTMDIPWFDHREVEYVYELRTPNPLGMSSGQYQGSLTYTAGPGGDFDMGDVMLPNDSVITLNFILDVQHSLKVEIPPGGNRIELLPQGGWQAWLNHGRKPVRLFRDQTFNLSSSSRFKMQLECQYPLGNTCALRDTASTDLVPLNTSVSLPGGLTDAAGQPVQRRPLQLDGSGTELFQPGFYVERKPGTLHFEVSREHVEQLLHPGVSKTYAGSVTVIWDSEV